VLQRQALADNLVRYLAQLGLERRHKVNKWYLKYDYHAQKREKALLKRVGSQEFQRLLGQT